jgi:rfaE bifunctional protein nucleotidyltransferase chain/domain
VLPSLKSSSFAEAAKQKIVSQEELFKILDGLKKQGKTIVTLNGSFDLMHAGHLEMIYQAALQGDVLVLALNSDASIKAYKSPLRPIIPLEYRLKMMSALWMVDFITWFEETDPRDLLGKIKPDVHVNGAEYGENCIEAEVVKQGGGRLHIVSLVPGLSTTQIIEKIKTVCV